MAAIAFNLKSLPCAPPPPQPPPGLGSVGGMSFVMCPWRVPPRVDMPTAIPYPDKSWSEIRQKFPAGHGLGKAVHIYIYIYIYISIYLSFYTG